MNFFGTIDAEAASRKLRYIVIGGLAINHYGYSRDTSDLDFFISQNDRMQWVELLAGFGYSPLHDGGHFIQYNPPEKNAWPVDLMLVKEKTFATIFEASREAEFFGVRTRVPLLDHLIALKLHALKNTRMHRFLKDFLDVENLIRINRLDIGSKQIRELFDKYGTQTCMKKYPARSLATEALHDAPLELPVEPDFISRPPKVELQAMLNRMEETMPWRNNRPGEAERRLAEKILVEFVL